MHRPILALLLALPLGAQQPAAELTAGSTKPVAARITTTDTSSKVEIDGDIKQQGWNFKPGSDDIFTTARGTGKLTFQSASGKPGPITIEYENNNVKRVCYPCGESQTCHEY